MDLFLIWPIQLSFGDEGSVAGVSENLAGLTVSFMEARQNSGMKKLLFDFDLFEFDIVVSEKDGGGEKSRAEQANKEACALEMRGTERGLFVKPVSQTLLKKYYFFGFLFSLLCRFHYVLLHFILYFDILKLNITTK